MLAISENSVQICVMALYLYGGACSFEDVMRGKAQQPPGGELLDLTKRYMYKAPDFPLLKLARHWLQTDKLHNLKRGMAMVLKYYYEAYPKEPMAPYIHLLAKLNDDFMRYGPTRLAKVMRWALNAKQFEMSEDDLKILKGYRKKWHGK